MGVRMIARWGVQTKVRQKMKALLLKALLSEYANQLNIGLEMAQSDLQVHLSPTRRRVWNRGTLAFFPPPEDAPPGEWHWVEEYPPHPALEQIRQALIKLEAFIDSLPTAEGNRP